MAIIRKFRLTGKKEISGVFRQGKAVKNDFLSVRFLKNRLNYPRAAIIVSVKVSKKATQRNTIKRKISAMVNGLIKTYGKKPIDLIVTVAPTILGKSPDKINSLLEQTIKEIFVN